MYTSGCPKNQKRCWKSKGSPPPSTSKNEVLKLRSVSNIVIPPANTGRDNNNKIAVNKIDQTNNGNLDIVIPPQRIFTIVQIKFIAPKIEDIPATCKDKIDKSTAAPECANAPDSGGYKVQPEPTPDSTKLEYNNKDSDGGNSQKLILFNLANAISGAPIRIGTNQLP